MIGKQEEVEITKTILTEVKNIVYTKREDTWIYMVRFTEYLHPWLKAAFSLTFN